MDEITLRNIKTIQNYTQETREMVRDITVKDSNTMLQIARLDQRIAALEGQVRSLLVAVHSGGATS